MSHGVVDQDLRDLSDRYRTGEWRAKLFYEAVARTLSSRGDDCVALDIGCGAGFDGDVELQRRLARMARVAIGVEPDPHTECDPCFSEVHRSLFEAAPIEPASVDVAWAVMVTEHVTNPDAFMGKIADVLADEGVFWAFSIDVRHWSAWASVALEKLRVKDLYLTALQGARGSERYENFPVAYRMNSPRAIRRHSPPDLDIQCANLFCVGAEDQSLPAALRPLNHMYDRLSDRLGWPGSNLVFRAVRRPRRS